MYSKLNIYMMTSSNGDIFRVTGPLCGEFTGHQWIPLTKASDTELWCFLWSTSDGWVNNENPRWFETPSSSLWHHYNVDSFKSSIQDLKLVITSVQNSCHLLGLRWQLEAKLLSESGHWNALENIWWLTHEGLVVHVVNCADVGSDIGFSSEWLELLLEIILADRQLELREQHSVKFDSKYENYLSQKYISKCHLQNSSHLFHLSVSNRAGKAT